MELAFDRPYCKGIPRKMRWTDLDGEKRKANERAKCSRSDWEVAEKETDIRDIHNHDH
jgi:hypothetical protein